MKRFNKSFLSFLILSVNICAMNNEDKYTKSRDFSKADQKISAYIINHNLCDKVQKMKKNAVFMVLKELDFLINEKDAKIFDYALWCYSDESRQILNEGCIDFKFDQLCERLVQNPPSIDITHNLGVAPLGRFRGECSSTVPLYGILKFIGQYTQNKSEFDKAVKTILDIKGKIKGPICSADEILFLMGMNQNFIGINIFPRPTSGFFYKKDSFSRSVYKPAPNQEMEWEEVEKRFASWLAYESFYKIEAQLLLIKSLLQAHYRRPESINTLVSDSRQDGIFIRNSIGLKQLAAEIMDYDCQLIRDENKEIELAAIGIVEGFDLQDSEDLMIIIDKALIYVNDENLLNLSMESSIKKLAFEKIFMLGIVPKDSDMAHYALRRAASQGCVWALEFLIKNGVNVNPPIYNQFRQWLFPEDRESPLKLALDNGHSKAVDFLRNAGAVEVLV